MRLSRDWWAVLAAGALYSDAAGQFAVLAKTARNATMRTNFLELRKQGWRPLVVGTVGEFAIAAITLALVLIVSRSAAL